MASKVGNYIHARRRQWALTQEELAFLLGYCTKTAVSKLEGRISRIPLRVALACHIIFGLEASELFPAIMEQVEEGLVRRIGELGDQLKCSRPSQATALKLQLLQEALARATSAVPHNV